MVSKVVIFLLSIVVFFFQATSALEPAPASSDANRIVAKISGHPVTEKQVLTIMKFTAFQNKNVEMPEDYLVNMQQGLFNAAIDTLTIRTLLLDKAQKQKITVSELELENIMQQTPKGYKSHAVYVKELKSYGIEEQEHKKHAEEVLKIQRVIDNAVKDTPEAPKEEVEKFYSGRKASILSAEQVRASHIMLTIAPKATSQQKKVIKEKLEKIKTDIETGKITFAEAAKKYSQDKATAALGGDLGIIYKGQKEAAIENALFNTPRGTIAPIVELKEGYYLVRVDDHKPQRQANLEETKALATQYYNQMVKRRAANKFMTKIKDEAKIEMLMTQEEFVKRNSKTWEGIFKK
jgi:parvulin-like peptidyl-prolyl isomerase